MVRLAAKRGLDVIALTDHDTTAGHAQAIRELPTGLTLLPGMELSCSTDGHSVHLLAYLFDPEDPRLGAELAAIRASRWRRAEAIVERLRDLGVAVTWARVRAIAGDGVVGRPHIARALVEAGAVDTAEEAFGPDWLASGGRAHVARYAPDPRQAIELVRAAGGVTVLAHPRGSARGWTTPDDVITELSSAGLDGIEVDHPGHSPAQRAALAGLAADLGLVVTGGSDDHGELTGFRLGAETTAASSYRVLVGRATGASPVTGRTQPGGQALASR